MSRHTPRIVMKFGATSVADLDRIRAVAEKVRKQVEAGCEVAVVVSAMSGVTNQLVGYCQSLSPLHDAREYDAIVATGEQVTSGLLSPTLNQPVALAYVEPGSAAIGTTLQAMVRGKAVPMQVQATPFVAPRYHRG